MGALSDTHGKMPYVRTFEFKTTRATPGFSERADYRRRGRRPTQAGPLPR